MKTTALFAACFAFLLLNAAGVESRRCHCDDDDNGNGNGSDQPSSYKLFVFGDSFADTGNLPKGDLKWETRGWYEPSGISDADHGNKPTGRCSDGMVQSDFLAKIILGQKEAPPPERIRRQEGVDLSSGINFALSGAGVFPGWNLDTQIDRFRRLLRHKIIDKDLSQSVALVSISSGADYSGAPSDLPDQDPLYIKNVTDGIVDGVRQLQDLGVANVLVNLMPPLGCTPWNTRADNYTKCEKDEITGEHNKRLMHKLGDDDSVLLLDLHAVFKSIVTTKTERQFYHRHTPCCESFEENEDGFCGQVDGEGNLQYTLCDRPDEYFYWDSTNPTQAGWKAVMEQLEGTIKDYLGI
ncbi:GDSL esterase/lipase [Dichanthelium oligosanthes]|uniref:GDSL esterase/lipase n=1 Tax=Dichanthelium oligosanthes TaxID=888268 RepID=A0A1E5WED0_9POAL|nr:GDSL esterase/lipase [Dichanthelium oligosanthes]